METHTTPPQAGSVVEYPVFPHNPPLKISTLGISEFAGTLFDKCFAALALLFFMPFIVLISLVILVTEGGPVFFSHQRVGKNGKMFPCLKFRTMAKDADEQLANLLARDPSARAQWDATQKLDDDPRITCIGEFFRKTSLDELPQFWNVLRGEMAIVGPRPIVSAELPRYGKHQDAYLSVKPGVTGSWQVNGRSTTTYDQRVEMDADYVRTKSFRKDIGIIVKTVKAVVTLDGAV